MCHVNRDSLTHCSQGSVAQLVEQRTSNPKVVVRIPPEPLNFSIIQLVISVLVIIIDVVSTTLLLDRYETIFCTHQSLYGLFTSSFTSFACMFLLPELCSINYVTK